MVSLDCFPSSPVPTTATESTASSSSSPSPPPSSPPMTEEEARLERQRAKARVKARRTYQRKMVRLSGLLAPPSRVLWVARLTDT